MMLFRALFFFFAGIPLAHGALLWSYSYSGGGVAGGGYLTTTNTQSGGAYSITGISGNRDALPVEFLLSAGTYPASGGGLLFSDNKLYPGSPALGLGGFTMQAGTDLYNVYNTGGAYYDLAGADCGAATCGQPGNLGTSIIFTATLVPSLEWQFAYSGTGVTAGGELYTLATPVSGHYQIIGVNGLRNGEAMNALFPAGTYSASGGGLLFSDNFLFPSDPFLATGGFTFHAGIDRYNLYNTGGVYYDLAGADCGGATCGQPGHLGTPVSFSISKIPEPSSLALIAAAVLAMLGMGTRGRKSLRKP
jgi:hypothetical protein